MTRQKASPAPWIADNPATVRGTRVTRAPLEVYVYANDAPEGERLAAIAYGPRAKANARLIAAAPALLETLRGLEYEAHCLMCGGGRYPAKDKVTGKPCAFNFHYWSEQARKVIEAAGGELG